MKGCCADAICRDRLESEDRCSTPGVIRTLLTRAIASFDMRDMAGIDISSIVRSTKNVDSTRCDKNWYAIGNIEYRIMAPRQVIIFAISNLVRIAGSIEGEERRFCRRRFRNRQLSCIATF